MKARATMKLLAAACLAGAALLLLACQAPVRQPDAAPRDWQPKRLAVLPFQVAAPDARGSNVRSPLTGASFVPGPIKDGANLIMDEALGRAMPDISSMEIIPVEMAGRVFDQLQRESLGLSLRAAAMEAGKRVGADGVLIGFIYRFTERVGETYSADKPASAAFDLALIRVGDGAVMWKNSFDESQRAVSEDLTQASQYMKRGVRWFSVQEWGEIGLEQLLLRFPWQKQAKEG